MAQLTQQDIDILVRYAVREERNAYWTYLAAKGDPYARLAGQVVRSDSFDGVVANRYAKLVATENGIIKTPEEWDKLGVDLMRADLDARAKLVEKNQGQAALFLDVDWIKKTHESSFAANGLALDAWTAWAPLQSAFSAGDLTAAQNIWNRMVETGFTNSVVNYAAVSGHGLANSPQWLGRVATVGAEWLEIGTDPISDPNHVRGYYFDPRANTWFAVPTLSAYSNIVEAPPDVAKELNAERMFRIALTGRGVLDANDARAQQSTDVLNVLSQPSNASGTSWTPSTLPLTYADSQTVMIKPGDTLWKIAADQKQAGNPITSDDLMKVNGLSPGQELKLQIGQQILVPQKVSGNLVVDYGNVRLSLNPVDGTYQYLINDPATTTTTLITRSLQSGQYSDRYVKTDNASGLELESYLNGVDQSYGYRFDNGQPTDNTRLDLSNAIGATGQPTWSDGTGDAGMATGADNLVLADGLLQAHFTGASTDGAHNLAGAIVTDGWMPGAEQLTPNDFTASIRNLADRFGPDPDAALLAGAEFANLSVDALAALAIDPLVLDLNGDGVRLTGYGDAPVLFDVDHDGGASREVTGWVSKDDGLVVMDLNGNGRIDGIQETLSEYFNGAAGSGPNAGEKKYANGFAALQSLDANANGAFDAGDAAWANVQVWTDANHDGQTDAGELQSLAGLGISRINLGATAQSGLTNHGNAIVAAGTFEQGGATREAVAATFIANPLGYTVTGAGNGQLLTADSGLKHYVSDSATGETVDLAALGVRNASGGAGNDSLIGDANANWLAGGAGADTFDAGAGDDVLLIDAQDQAQNIHAGAGFDTVHVVGDGGVTLNLAQAEIEVAVGGRGNDLLIGGGRSNVFIEGGDGDDLLMGGAADDALNGQDGDDLIDGGAGDDIVRGGRGQDQLLGGAGDDLLEGGQDDDQLAGGAGNDVLKGQQGDDRIDGGDGYDVVELAGNHGDYRLTRLDDHTLRIVDTRSGRDGADLVTDVEAVNFADLRNIRLDQAIPMAVDDVVSVAAGAPSYVLTQASLFGNDVNVNGDALQLRSFGDAVGGTVGQNPGGDLVFTPSAGYAGVMSFTYSVQNSAGHMTATLPNGQSADLKATVTLRTPDLPIDPLFAEQRYLNDVKVVPVWPDYTGKGVRIGQFEPNAPFQTDTTVFDYRHPDLQANADAAWLASGTAPAEFSNHATMVAGIMVAARNGEGAVGVAYDAKLSGVSIDRTDGSGTPDWTVLDQWQHYDIVNNSWNMPGNFAANYLLPAYAPIEDALVDAVGKGRNGLGTAMVFSAGNQRTAGQDANQMLSNSRFAIQVGSINAVGDLGALTPAQVPYSNRGASILVAAPGSNVTTTSRLLMNDDGSVFGSEAAAVNGTSFAAPIVSGVIALMLEANPKLGYRDIQEILALSATKVATDPAAPTDWMDNHATNWNGGGMHVSHDYGFGQVDARAAVRLAESWGVTSTTGNGAFGQNNEAALDSGQVNINAAIPDGGAYTQSIAMGAGLSVEHVEVLLDIDHQKYGDLVVKLISPTGTESVLINRPANGTEPGNGELRYVFSSTHDWGEASAGTWKIQVTDAAGGNVGTLKFVDLKLYGKNSIGGDDTYYYTDEFASIGSGGRLTLAADSNGGIDTINAAAVTSNTTVNLTTGTASIAGKPVSIVSPENLENVVGGDGNDTLTGNAGTNRLVGGRGSDVLVGGAGRDILEGGAGNDTMTGGTETDLFAIRKEVGATDVIADFSVTGREKIALVGFGGLSYAGLTIAQEGANTRVTLGGGQSVVLTGVTASLITADSFSFLDSFNFARQYIGTNATDATFEFATPTLLPGLYMAGAGDDFVYGSYGQDVIYGEDGNDTLVGEVSQTDVNGAGDKIYGGAGNDRIFGCYGDDTLYGGDGNDLVVGDAGNDTIYLEGDVYAGQYYVLGGDGSDRFVLTNTAVSAGFVNVVGDFNIADSAEKIDLSTITSVTSFSQLVLEQVDIDGDGTVSTRVKTGSGSAPSLILYGVASNQVAASQFVFYQPPSVFSTSTGDAGGNVLMGTTGADALNGRTGDDIYVVDNVGDTVSELPDGGFDTVKSSLGYTLAANVENLVLTGTAATNGTGNDLANRITGNAAANVLDGGAGADTLLGGAGNDTYIVDNQADTVIEYVGEGTDTVQSSVSYTLGNDIEKLVLTGTASINATGNALSNTLTGNAGDNLLDGAEGADMMVGGAGDDTYIVDNAGDTVTENANEGVDTIYSTVNVTLSENVENLVLATGATTGTGNALDNWLVGNSAANVLSGGAGADTLSGGADADTMVGGLGDDTYVIDNAGDEVTENAGEGNDTIMASVSIDLGSRPNVENVVLTGTANLTATGNMANNRLYGNAGNNILTGGAGADTLNGGTGSDTAMYSGIYRQYSVSGNAAMVGSIAGPDGTDNLFGIEQLKFVDGTLSFDPSVDNGGSWLPDQTAASVGRLYWGALGRAADVGGLTNWTHGIEAGQFTLAQAAAAFVGSAEFQLVYGTLDNTQFVNQLYLKVLDRPADAGGVSTWLNALNGGTSRGDVMLAFTESAEFKQRASSVIDKGIVVGTQLQGTAGDDVLRGNNLVHDIVGLAGNDTLSGGTGNDILAGGAGNDILDGGVGNDTYRFDRGDGPDLVTENDATSGNTDLAAFASGIATDQLWFRHLGNNLEISIIGTADSLAIQDWYAGSAHHIEQFKTADNLLLLDTAVENLVQAMAAFAPPTAGQTALPQNYRDALAPILAANWH